METIEIIQNSDQWHEIRKKRLGASDANIVMGVSNFTTPLGLYRMKKSTEVKDDNPNFIQAKGHKLEEKMRPNMELIFDTEFTPIVALCDEYDFLMASLDGYSHEKSLVWENKYVGQDDFTIVKNGIMLDKYIPQVQQQMFVTGCEKCLFSVITEDKESTNKKFPYKYCWITIDIDTEYIKNELLPKMIEFKGFIDTDTEPPISEDDVIDLSENAQLLNLLEQYESVSLLLKKLTENEKQIKKKIFKISKAKKTTCHNYKITNSKSKGSFKYDYEKYCKEQLLEIPVEYRKDVAGRRTQRITIGERDE